MEALACKHSQLRSFTREAFEFIGSALPHCAQCACLRREQPQQMLFAPACVGQACGVVRDQRFAFVVQSLYQIGEQAGRGARG